MTLAPKEPSLEAVVEWFEKTDDRNEMVPNGLLGNAPKRSIQRAEFARGKQLEVLRLLQETSKSIEDVARRCRVPSSTVGMWLIKARHCGVQFKHRPDKYRIEQVVANAERFRESVRHSQD